MTDPTFSPLPLKASTKGTKAASGRALSTAASLVIVLAGLKAAEELLVPLVFAVFLAVLTAPAVIWLEQKKSPPWLAVSCVLLLLLAVFVGLGTILGGSVNAFVAAVPRYQLKLNELLERYTSTLEAFGYTVSQESLQQMLNPAAFMTLVGDLMSQLASLLSNTALIVLTMVFILLEVATLPRKLRRALGDPFADLSRYAGLVQELKRYVVIKTYLSAVTGVLIGGFLTVLRVDFALLWALVVFLLNYIPNIGSIIAAIPPVLLALVQFGLGTAVATTIGFVVVNAVIGNLLEPRLLGRKLGLSTLVVFLSLVFWGWLWGPMGMLLSVPLTMLVKILLESSAQFMPVAVLMGPPRSQRTTMTEDFRPTLESLENPPPSSKTQV